ncbi:MAG: biotin--[acetyl-CoA-carboxylase] ligase [Puniceicoccales bacterium]|jgi:BirA family biotin operon repressor/biotin-[acetyl-CoA-carboxylase] ligase|nr:biotin--[acetyl-CoA-carboxylase] ligase [Puniceicoccales bacterium]
MDTTRIILETFLEAGDKRVSGDKLARALGVSRVSVWTRLEQLRSQGFVFEAAPRVGYRLAGLPEVPHAALLQTYLQRMGVTAPVHCLDSVDSTNNEAERRLGAGDATPFVVVASEQTAGRGRMGRPWDSRRTGNLYMSFAFRPQIAPENMQTITLDIGLRLCARLAQKHGLPIQIKWPNDLMCGGRKIAGILTEARIDADHVRDIVFGIGLNVNGRLADFPPELRGTAGSLAHALGSPLDISAVAADCIGAVLDACARFIAHGRTEDFNALWQQHDFLAGKTVTARGAGKEATGAVAGLDARGALLVRTADGTVLALNAGEVTLSGRQPPLP